MKLGPAGRYIWPWILGLRAWDTILDVSEPAHLVENETILVSFVQRAPVHNPRKETTATWNRNSEQQGLPFSTVPECRRVWDAQLRYNDVSRDKQGRGIDPMHSNTHSHPRASSLTSRYA